jgi:CheY-like chemotaxis protein
LLAIDDQSVILDLIAAMGQSLGYEVQTASTGEEGLKLAEAGRFDVILTDLALPGISGLEVARRISRVQPNVPIILVTGWATEMGAEERRRAGIREVLYKPFRIEQLTALVQSLIPSPAPS